MALNRGVGSWPGRRARSSGDHVALVHDDVTTTYRQLDDRVSRLAGALRDKGIRRGDRIAYLGRNHPSLLETLFAAGLLGAVFVPLNTRLAEPELEYMIEDAGVSLLVHGDTGHELGGQRISVVGDYEDLLASGAALVEAEPVGLDDPCMIMYTSGTTGRPKGAVLTHGNITWNCVNSLVDVDHRADEVGLVIGPLFHAAALNMDTLPTLVKGGTVVLAGGFDPDETLRLIERHGVSHIGGVATMYDLLTRSPLWDTTDLSTLRYAICGGSPIPEHLMRRYLERGVAFQQAYGMTEAGPGVLMLSARDAFAKVGSAGTPHFFTDVRVVRPDLTEVALGEPGEVLVSGPHLTEGYWGLSDTGAFTDDGWFRSGDIARVDSDGFGFVVDRVKDMIISGGENIYPAEVEQVLRSSPLVVDCAVIGVPDPKWGEVGAALVVLEADAQESDLLGFLAGKLAKYKVPKSVTVVEALPRNASGKLDKVDLRRRYGV